MKYSELKEGMVVWADDGFDCLESGEHVVRDYHGEFYIDCSHGKHFLSAQCAFEDNDTLIGIDFTTGEGRRSGYYY